MSKEPSKRRGPTCMDQFLTSAKHNPLRSTMASQKELQEVVEEHSTSRYFIEHSLYFSNHMTHGLVALHRLGATKDRLYRFATWYGSGIFPPENPLNIDSSPVTPGNIEDLKGEKLNYYGILKHFEGVLEEKYNGSVDGMINGEFPSLMLGFAGAALHGGIQTAYGLASGSQGAVVEGIAYSYYAYLPMEPSSETLDFELGSGSKPFLEVLQAVRDDKHFQERVTQKAKDVVLTNDAGEFPKRVIVLLTHEADTVIKYVKQIQFPAELSQSTSTAKWSHEVPRWLLESALDVYARTLPRNDFFLLHGVTGGWALSQLLSKLTTSRHVVDACKVFTAILLALYVTEGTPEFVGLPEPEMTWESAISRVLAEDREPHDVKLLHVCKEISDTSGDKSEVKATCLAAASIVLSHPFKFTEDFFP